MKASETTPVIPPQMIHFELFVTWYAGGTWLSWDPQTITFLGLGSWNKYFVHLSEKRKSSYSSVVRFLYCLANFRQAARCLTVNRGYISFAVSAASNLRFSWTFRRCFFPATRHLLANCCESCLVEFSLLYLVFFRTFLATSFRTFGLPVHFLSSKPSFLDDNLTTQRSDLSNFF